MLQFKVFMLENTNKNDIVYFARLHWIIFLGPVLALCVALAFAFYLPQLRLVSHTMTFFFLIWIFMTWVTYYSSSLTIKVNQVILRTGIIVRNTIDIPLSKIEAIDIRQSIPGSILGYGSICITGTGGTRRIINYLHHPLKCRQYIEQLINKVST